MSAISPIMHLITSESVCVEIGVRYATSSINILSRAKFLYCIDPWENYEGYLESLVFWKVYNAAMRKLSPFVEEGRARVIRDYASNVVNDFADESLDFIFVDGNHSYKYVIEDILNWWPKVRVGGYLTGDDYGLNKPPTHEMAKAVDEFIELKGLKLDNYVGGCWVIKKG